MPTVPRQNKCAHLGCSKERSALNTYCIDHGGKDCTDTPERKKANAMYQTARWSRLRIRQLSKSPLCQSCASRGKVTPATDIDHLFAWQDIGADAFYRNIFQSLCRNCHTVKGGLERKGIYRHYINQEAHDYDITDYDGLCHSQEA